MIEDKLLQKLKNLIDKYIEDSAISADLKDNVTVNKVKYVLGELELHKAKRIEPEDKELIKDLYFHFC